MIRILTRWNVTIGILFLITLFVLCTPDHCQESLDASQNVDTTDEIVGGGYQYSISPEELAGLESLGHVN